MREQPPQTLVRELGTDARHPNIVFEITLLDADRARAYHSLGSLQPNAHMGRQHTVITYWKRCNKEQNVTSLEQETIHKQT